jgi:predicted DNA-binding antitoxin AbrB/MazE fold protein
MTYKGHIKNGAVVLDQPVALPEGAEVKVDLVAEQPAVPLAESLKGVIGKATGLPSDASSQKRHYLYGHPKS